MTEHTGASRLPPFYRISGGTNFYFLRHGESRGNTGGIIQGRQDFPLSPQGEEHAKSAAAWLKSRKIEYVLSSPLERSLHTAEIVSREAQLPPPVTDNLLTELDTGPFTGCTFSEVAERFPEQWNRFRELSWEGVEGAETAAQLSGRASDYWEKLIDLAEEGKRHILSVTHSGFLQWLIKTANGAAAGWMPLYSIANCGIFHLYVSPPRAGGTDVRLSSTSFYAQWKLINHIPYQIT